MTTALGRIHSARFGFGGYDGAMFGLSVDLRMDGSGVGDFCGTWADPPSSYDKWSIDDQSKTFADSCRLLIKTLREARKQDVSQLAGTPVEVTLNGTVIVSWRVLTEVIG